MNDSPDTSLRRPTRLALTTRRALTELDLDVDAKLHNGNCVLDHHEDTEGEGEFEDAMDAVQPTTSTSLLDTIAETQITLNLFMNNKFDEAELRMKAMADRTMYHALGYSTIIFIRAMMTCDRRDMERALQTCKDAGVVIERFRYRASITESISRSLMGGMARSFSDEELHAELCYAESLLFRAVLTFFNDDGLTSFVRGALKIRSCYQTFKECHRLLETTTFDGRCSRLRAQFESGTRSGLGTFNLMLSVLPSRILRLLEVVGFSGNKGFTRIVVGRMV